MNDLILFIKPNNYFTYKEYKSLPYQIAINANNNQPH